VRPCPSLSSSYQRMPVRMLLSKLSVLYARVRVCEYSAIGTEAALESVPSR